MPGRFECMGHDPEEFEFPDAAAEDGYVIRPPDGRCEHFGCRAAASVRGIRAPRVTPEMSADVRLMADEYGAAL